MLEGNRIAAELGITDDVKCLPFVQDGQAGGSGGYLRKFWVVPSSGDEVIDAANAAKMADMLVLYMAKTGFSPLLGSVVSDMVAASRFGSIELEFLGRLANYAMRGICMKPEHVPPSLRD